MQINDLMGVPQLGLWILQDLKIKNCLSYVTHIWVWDHSDCAMFVPLPVWHQDHANCAIFPPKGLIDKLWCNYGKVKEKVQQVHIASDCQIYQRMCTFPMQFRQVSINSWLGITSLAKLNSQAFYLSETQPVHCCPDVPNKNVSPISKNLGTRQSTIRNVLSLTFLLRWQVQIERRRKCIW